MSDLNAESLADLFYKMAADKEAHQILQNKNQDGV